MIGYIHPAGYAHRYDSPTTVRTMAREGASQIEGAIRGVLMVVRILLIAGLIVWLARSVGRQILSEEDLELGSDIAISSHSTSGM
jgi:hypothetical protein